MIEAKRPVGSGFTSFKEKFAQDTSYSHYQSTGEIRNSYVNGVVESNSTSHGSYAGGLVGSSWDCTILVGIPSKLSFILFFYAFSLAF